MHASQKLSLHLEFEGWCIWSLKISLLQWAQDFVFLLMSIEVHRGQNNSSYDDLITSKHFTQIPWLHESTFNNVPCTVWLHEWHFLLFLPLKTSLRTI